MKSVAETESKVAKTVRQFFTFHRNSLWKVKEKYCQLVSITLGNLLDDNIQLHIKKDVMVVHVCVRACCLSSPGLVGVIHSKWEGSLARL